MQEIHSIGGGGRFFGGGGAGTGDRRLRPHSHHQQNNHQHQALKCPRCDSLNTKFCYYNNYNLSQPRHFCKNCRRYWTKGGVLRNVPVGGGCRKSKRSSNTTPKSKTTSTSSSAETTPQTTSSQQPEHNSNSHSSSESSSLTAAATANATATVTELNSDTSNKMIESKSLLIHENPSSNPNLESGALEQGAGDCGGIFSEIGTFSSLIASNSTNNDALAFGFGGVGVVPHTTSFQWQQHSQHQKMQEGLNGGGNLMDHGHGAAVTVDLSVMQGKTGHGGFGPLDWQGGTDQGLFDLPNTVDQAYWSHTQWSDQDNSALFHLP